MPKRSPRGRQGLRSSKGARTRGTSNANEAIDWNISSDEASNDDEIVMNTPSEQSEEEAAPENTETAEERKLRLAKEYLERIRLEEKEKEEGEESEEGETDDEGVEQRVEQRLQREAEEARGRVFKEVASQLKGKTLPESRFCKGHLMPVTCTDISGDEHYIVSGGKDCKACLWDVETGKVIRIFEGKRERLDSPKRKDLNCHRGEVLAVQMSYDGQYVVTAGREGLIRIWDSRCGKNVGEETVESVSGQETVVKSGIDHVTDCKDILRGHRGLITSLLLQRDNILYSGGVDNTLKLWNIVDTTYIDTLYGHESLITCLSGQRHTVASNNNTRILSCSTDKSLRLWKIEANTQMVYRGKKASLSMECCSMVSLQNFVVGDAVGSLSLFAAAKKKPVFAVPNAHGVAENGEGKWVVSCAALPFTNVLASGSYDDCIRLWDVNPSNREKDGELLKSVNAIPVKGFVNSISFAPSGRFMVAGIGQEHRMGRWWRSKGVKNGILIQKLDLDLSV